MYFGVSVELFARELMGQSTGTQSRPPISDVVVIEKEKQNVNACTSLTIVSCCSGNETPINVQTVADTVPAGISVQLRILTTTTENRALEEVVLVSEGTKLSKIRRFSQDLSSDFICICDPDLEVDPKATSTVIETAVNISTDNRAVVAYGIVDCREEGTLLSRIIAIDKWFSHRVLRPSLWRLGMGISIPGQFLVLSTSVLQRLDPDVDSYLDDLYLGWIARSMGARVVCIPEVVGAEKSRTKWSSLLTQRLRWMRGFMSLVLHLSGKPKALGFLLVHFVTYHGIPILWLVSLILIATISTSIATVILAIVSGAIALLGRRSFASALAFIILFPLLHCLAVLLWWVPVSHHRLTQR
ncbi:MAG TPA: glycosyltransferase family 2 protein [Gammaproteobacteria bacterium]|nr:glycosyltransferase family 2 protein [Gammaproteobacteria bacterium]